MKNVGIYIHIPFCKSKCYYCDFTSFANCEDKVHEYVELLKQEIHKSEEYNAKTIYIGGGTPSFIEPSYIRDILGMLHYTENTEITIEVNPGTVNEEKLKEYYNMGINRLSIGLQSTDNTLLRQIGRIHKYEDFLNTYNLARKVGFNNINVDLIIGLPNQTIKTLEDSLNKVLELAPEHISVYSLILEEGTKLEGLVNKGEMKLPNDEIERKMYWIVKNKLEEAGYIHYEISNFAKPGYYSKHNIDCWNQEEYIGFGLGAHSYLDNVRYSNTTNLNEYMKSESTIEEVQTEYTKMQEYVMLGLRKIQGVNIEDFYNKFKKDINETFSNEITKLRNLQLIEQKNGYLKLSKRGIDLANQVWQEFV